MWIPLGSMLWTTTIGFLDDTEVEVSTFSKWHGLYAWALYDGCQMLECAMFRSYCKSFFFYPLMKKKRTFSSTVQLLTLTKKLKTSHARDTNKSTGNARLSSSTE